MITKPQMDYLQTLEVNPKLLAKLPKKKLARTLSIASELRKLSKAFWWFHSNAIVLEVSPPGMYRKTILINATLMYYKIRVETWPYCGGGSFFVKEIQVNNGNSLLWELVSLEVLDSSFLPKISDLHEKLNEL